MSPVDQYAKIIIAGLPWPDKEAHVSYEDGELVLQFDGGERRYLGVSVEDYLTMAEADEARRAFWGTIAFRYPFRSSHGGGILRQVEDSSAIGFIGSRGDEVLVSFGANNPLYCYRLITREEMIGRQAELKQKILAAKESSAGYDAMLMGQLDAFLAEVEQSFEAFAASFNAETFAAQLLADSSRGHVVSKILTWGLIPDDREGDAGRAAIIKIAQEQRANLSFFAFTKVVPKTRGAI